MLPINKSLMRLRTVLQHFPVSRSKWYAGMKTGLYPMPIKVGRLSLWLASDIQKLIDQLSTKEAV